jgi:hypothetical protein
MKKRRKTKTLTIRMRKAAAADESEGIGYLQPSQSEIVEQKMTLKRRQTQSYERNEADPPVLTRRWKQESRRS